MKNQVALITGASRGIGKAVALLLAEKGYTIILNARNGETLENTLTEINDKHPNGDHYQFRADITSPDERETLFNFIHDKFDRLDILINNIPGGKPDSFHDTNNQDIEETFVNKSITYIDCMKKAYPLMNSNKFGRIINVVGNLWKEPGENMFSNGLVNAAIINASKNVANVVAKDGITVNCLNPGFIKTDRYHSYIESVMNQEQKSSDEVETAVFKNIPAKRVGLPNEIASLIVYLVSQDASYITGQQISVDGGILKSL
jgi:NAD(P)-dependent dehydrogenase (short-subunit alcohol dehydrogenase family)